MSSPHTCEKKAGSPSEQSWSTPVLLHSDQQQQQPFLHHSYSSGTPPSHPDASGHVVIRLFLGAISLSLVLAAALLIPLAILLGYIFLWHGASIQGLYILTGASSNRVITITGVVSKVAEQTIVPTLGIMASLAAAKWVRHSQTMHTSNQVPTSLQ